MFSLRSGGRIDIICKGSHLEYHCSSCLEKTQDPLFHVESLLSYFFFEVLNLIRKFVHALRWRDQLQSSRQVDVCSSSIKRVIIYIYSITNRRMF